MNAKIMRINTRQPSESFGKTFTDYIKQLPPNTAQVGGTVMENIWCRPGKTNIQYVEGIFNAILVVPEL